jgi:hypothetical protein
MPSDDKTPTNKVSAEPAKSASADDSAPAPKSEIYVGPTDKAIGLNQYTHYLPGPFLDAVKARCSALQLSQFKPLDFLLTHNFKDSQRAVIYHTELVPKTP